MMTMTLRRTREAASGWRLALPLMALLAGCAAGPAPTATTATTATSAATANSLLRLIGMQQLAADLRHDAILVGGVSGMDYDAASGDWLLASDDRGQHGPARLYRARIDVAAAAPVAVTAAIVLHQADGAVYPAWGQPGVSADLEALRIDPAGGGIWIASEGDRKARVPSFVRRVDARGMHAAELPYPPSLQIQPDCACGGRSNMGFEGIGFTDDGALLWMALEAPPIQDGAVPGPGRGALTRITLADRAGQIVAQYAYPLDPAPARTFPGGFVDNGISEILASGPQRLLVLERAGRQIVGKRFSFDVRLYEVDLAQASTIDPDVPLGRQQVIPGVKRLLFETSQLPAEWADNYEAMAWGPALPNGHRALVIASDNNFNGGPTRFLVFDGGAAQP